MFRESRNQNEEEIPGNGMHATLSDLLEVLKGKSFSFTAVGFQQKGLNFCFRGAPLWKPQLRQSKNKEVLEK